MRVSPNNLIVPLLASFSLTSVGAILLYFLNKKKNKDEDLQNKSFQLNSIEIKIPRQSVPLIIGRAGAVIKNIQLSTNTIISFKEENNIESTERTCVITGNKENIAIAEEKIKYILMNQPIIETYEMWVPQRTINTITERGNEILNQIHNLSNAKIILDNSVAVSDTDFYKEPTKRIIINGTPTQISQTVMLIEDKVREDRKRQEKNEISLLNRAPRVKSLLEKTLIENSLIDVGSKKALHHQETEGLIEVFVCACENPSQFYIQVIGPGNSLLDDLVKEMTEYYEFEENRKLHSLRNITIGQMVAAKFSIDNKWYRAEIIAELGNQEYIVYFVDFGDREEVHENYIVELCTDFLSLRLQAVECCLADIKPRDGDWSREASMAFSQLSALANWQARVAKIKGYKERASSFRPSKREGSPIPCIELYEKRDDQLINIGQELIKLELASPEDDSSWSGTSTTLTDVHGERPRNQEAVVEPVEEIDLTKTPKSPNDVEIIDLTSPSKDSKTNGSLHFVDVDDDDDHDDEDDFPVYHNVNVNNITAIRHPFKREQKSPQRIIYPAGYESELSDDSDGFDVYSGAF